MKEALRGRRFSSDEERSYWRDAKLVKDEAKKRFF
jgi:hypothetical protein